MTEPNPTRKFALRHRLPSLPAIVVSGALSVAVVAGSGDGRDGTSAPETATVQTAASIRANLASVAASSFDPGNEGVVDLATFGAVPSAALLNVPAPGSMSPAPTAVDHIPEPGAIGFGLAVAALIFGNFIKSVKRCWKITSATHGRGQ